MRRRKSRKPMLVVMVVLVLFATGIYLVSISSNGADGRYILFGPQLPASQGSDLKTGDIVTLSSLFDDTPFHGNQSVDFISKWVNENAFVFLEFDKNEAGEATRLLFLGIGVKGVFCEENRPGEDFTHFRKWSVSGEDTAGGGQRGDQGYWMMRVAVGDFAVDGINIATGVDEKFDPTPPPSCGDNVPHVDITVPSGEISSEDRAVFEQLFSDSPLKGGQSQPRISKWISDDVFLFLQFTSFADGTKDLRYVGMGKLDNFCKSARPSEDFSHFQRINSPIYDESAQKGEAGYWMLWIAMDNFNVGGRDVAPGIDRNIEYTDAPLC